MNDDLEVQRGRLAEEVLNNPVYAEAYAQIEQELTRKWRESKSQEQREELHCLVRSLALVQTVLDSTMRSGKVAADNLTRKATLAERTIGRLRNIA